MYLVVLTKRKNILAVRPSYKFITEIMFSFVQFWPLHIISKGFVAKDLKRSTDNQGFDYFNPYAYICNCWFCLCYEFFIILFNIDLFLFFDILS